MKQGVTYDTGMLIALERYKQRALETHERLRERKIRVTVPLAVVTEWWRGRTEDRDDIVRSIDFETDEAARRSAKLAGEALAGVQTRRDAEMCRCKFLVDAIVMASASLRGDVVYTADFDDLSLFSRRFPNVRLFTA